MDIKIHLKVLQDSPIPSPCKNKRQVGVEERVNHAIDCIDAQVDVPKAVAFLQRIYNKLESLERPSETAQILIEKIRPVMGMFGNVPEAKESDNA